MPNSYDRDREYRSRHIRQQDYVQQQPEQFHDDFRQQDGDSGDNRYGDVFASPSRAGGIFNQRDDYRSRGFDDNRYDPLGDYDRAAYRDTPSMYDRPASSNQDFYRGSDMGRTSRIYGSAPSRFTQHGDTYQRSRSDWSMPPRPFNEDDRGFFDRASDEVMSWFGDDDAARRRRMDHASHRGRGPSNYQRSPERLLEDACERLTNDPYVDARNVNVTVTENEVTLDGTVNSRSAKRRAEDCVNDISGVKHVQNNLRVDDSVSATWNGTTTPSRTDIES